MNKTYIAYSHSWKKHYQTGNILCHDDPVNMSEIDKMVIDNEVYRDIYRRRLDVKRMIKYKLLNQN